VKINEEPLNSPGFPGKVSLRNKLFPPLPTQEKEKDRLKP
jgi:hypothetical protein